VHRVAEQRWNSCSALRHKPRVPGLEQGMLCVLGLVHKNTCAKVVRRAAVTVLVGTAAHADSLCGMCVRV